MLRRTLLLALLVTPGCASAVNESLERRGVDRGDLLVARVEEAASALSAARRSVVDARAASETLGGEGAMLARSIDRVAAARQVAYESIRPVRVRNNAARKAVENHLADQAQQASLLEPSGRARAQADLAAERQESAALLASLESAADAHEAYTEALGEVTRFLSANRNAAALGSQKAALAALGADTQGALSALDAAIARAELFAAARR